MPFLYSSKNKSNHQNVGFKIPNFSRDSSYTNEFPPTIMCQSCHQTFNSHQDYSSHELSCCGILPPPRPELEGSKSPTNSSFSSDSEHSTQSPPPHLHCHTHTHNHHTLFSSHQPTRLNTASPHHHHMQSLSFLEDTPPITSNINSFDLFHNSNDDELPAPMEEEEQQQNVDNKFNKLFKSDNTTPEQLSIPVSELIMSTPVLESEQMLSSSLLPPLPSFNMTSSKDYFNQINTTNTNLSNTTTNPTTSNPFNMSSITTSPDPMSFLSSTSDVPSFNGQPFLSDKDSQVLLGLDIPVLDRQIDDTTMKEEQDDDLPPPPFDPSPTSNMDFQPKSSPMHSRNDFPEIFPLKPEQPQSLQPPPPPPASSTMKSEENNYKLPALNMSRSSSSSKEMFLPEIPSSARSSSLVYEKYDAENDQKVFIDPLDGSEFHDYEFLNEENFDKNRFVQCSKCLQSFYGKGELYDHIKSTHWFHCDECSAIFAVYEKLMEHKSNKHSLEKIRDFCKHCGKGFDNPKYLKKHEMRHEKCFICDTCPKSFGSRESLKIHKRTHDGDKPLKCKVCNRGFADPSALRRHLNTHSGLKPFECELCHRRFARKDTLQKHMVTHTGEKAFKCEHCGRDFGHKSSLQRHKKKLHSGQ